MWKFALVILAVNFSMHAEIVGESEMGGDEQQDGEDYAVTPGNPSLGDDPVTGEKNDPAACLSRDTIKRYENKARRATSNIKSIARKAKSNRVALRNVRLALQKSDLLPKSVNSLGSKAETAGPQLESHKFVNLMHCKEWREKNKGGAGEIPLGAVLIYKGGPYGDARLKTAEGCIGATPNSTACTNARNKLTGVYVKVVN